MRWTLTSLVATLRALVSRSRLDDELKAEIDLHIELRRQSLVQSGMVPRDAAYEARSNTIDVIVARLRRKLEQDGGRRLIHAEPGVGYVARAPREESTG